MVRHALGLIETKGLTGAIEACDAAARAAEVVIASAEPLASGRVTVKIEGDWQAVKAAVSAGARAAEQAGELVSMHVIPKTDDSLGRILPYRSFVDRFGPGRSQASASGPRARPRPRAAPASPSPPEAAAPAPKLPLQPAAAPSAPPTGKPEIRSMSVVKLRRYARGIPDLPIQGRQISMATKEQLLAAIESVTESGSEADN
jgi:microcompartment protein CcmL/EutN